MLPLNSVAIITMGKNPLSKAQVLHVVIAPLVKALYNPAAAPKSGTHRMRRENNKLLILLTPKVLCAWNSLPATKINC